jgi:ketosteroid isomerase-like protein
MDDPMVTIERLVRATNAHDIDAIVACFAEDYVLDAPAHPARSFRGNAQVRSNWTQILGGVPDVTMKLTRSACDGETVWTEMEMRGTRRDGVAHAMCGVFIFGVREDLIRWGRIFLEPVDAGAGDMSAAVREQLGPR